MPRSVRPSASDADAPLSPRPPDLCEISVTAIGTTGPNPRALFEMDGEAGLADLAASIRAQGLLHPIIVRPAVATDADGPATPPSDRRGSADPRGASGPAVAALRPTYVLVAGERRLRAVRDVLKGETITAIVRHDLTAATATAATVLENLQRRDLHPMEEARGLALLRQQGQTPAEIARCLGRREAWVKERLLLCDLPTRAQDLYLRSRSGRLTLQRVLTLHDYTRGGRDNSGFPALIITLLEDMDKGINPDGHLGTLAGLHSGLVRRLTHWGQSTDGTWSGHYFDTADVCRRCPFAAYRRGHYDGEGYCLLPDHYTELRTTAKARYEEARAAQVQAMRADPAAATIDRPIGAGRAATAAQKAAQTRKRHQQQRAAYYPHVYAIEHAIDMIANVDGVDVAVLAAYTLTLPHIQRAAVEQVVRRHGLADFPGPDITPTVRQIARLRAIEPVALVRYTLEALLLTQAMRARDYDPGKAPPDDVLALYVPGQEAQERPAERGARLAAAGATGHRARRRAERG